MIISKIQGGLGNQMFQWAFGKALSLELNLPYIIDTSFYDNQTLRKFELNYFKDLKYLDLNNPNIKFKNKQFVTINDYFTFFTAIDQIQNHLGKNLYLNGYWQSEKYFFNYKQEILSDFTFNEKTNNLSTLIEPDSVSIHIRRTDYVSLSDHHPVQPISYYESALELIGDYNKLYVFSDDIIWCRENLKFNNMVFIDGNTNLEDLQLMSLCKYNIIANSSFSWWAAYLNQNQNKTIIAPINWFGPKLNCNISDIIPNTWRKI